ncbi:E2-like enzyme [Apophysomyces sp. BC1015]|nr:E2-like enzyme [Apophysomyces sp. BC1015]
MREYLAPVLKDSKFKETGCLTPDEVNVPCPALKHCRSITLFHYFHNKFIAAGEFLVYKCPTWSWKLKREAGLPEKTRDYLPSDKQFLVTRNVPCLRRASQMEYTDDDDETQLVNAAGLSTDKADEKEEDGWMYTHSSRVMTSMDEIAHTIMDEEEEEDEAQARQQLESLNLGKETSTDVMPDIDDIPDIEDDQVVEEEDPATAPKKDAQDTNDKILQVRTYDVFITYDKYYQTPRMWLFGYDEERRPLTSNQVFDDVAQDYVKKTVTIETHPHMTMSLASIHPCKHAEVMKKIIERMDEGVVVNSAGEAGIRVDQYLIIFLKFMSSVVPTIDYDHTISA